MPKIELDGLMARLRRELISIGIPVSNRLEPEVRINTRARRRLGCCYYQSGRYWIEVSQAVLEDEDLLNRPWCTRFFTPAPSAGTMGQSGKPMPRQ